MRNDFHETTDQNPARCCLSTRRNFLTSLSAAILAAVYPASQAGSLAAEPDQRPRQRPAERLIYAVDDEPALTELYRIILDSAGYRVKALNDRVEALKSVLAAADEPELLITDFDG